MHLAHLPLEFVLTSKF